MYMHGCMLVILYDSCHLTFSWNSNMCGRAPVFICLCVVYHVDHMLNGHNYLDMTVAISNNILACVS